MPVTLGVFQASLSLTHSHSLTDPAKTTKNTVRQLHHFVHSATPPINAHSNQHSTNVYVSTDQSIKKARVALLEAQLKESKQASKEVQSELRRAFVTVVQEGAASLAESKGQASQLRAEVEAKEAQVSACVMCAVCMCVFWGGERQRDMVERKGLYPPPAFRHVFCCFV